MKGGRPAPAGTEPAILRILLVPVLAALAAVPAAADPPALEPTAGAAAATSPLHPDRAQELAAGKIGQMLVIGFPGTAPGDEWPARAAAMIAAGRIGGVILFGHNVRSPAQLRRLVAALHEAGGGLPPFVAVDQEGGRIQRLTRRQGFRYLPSARALAAEGVCAAEAAYRATALELAGLGINVNLGPVVDLDINPQSPAIGRLARSYGREPRTVVAFARAFIGAHEAAGVLAAAKHFPGHGSAALDPHHRVVDITATWQPAELETFRALADEVAMVMVGHLIHPRFSDGDRPTSLSRRTITGELRGRLGFDGLVVTDDLGMDAITRRFSQEEAAVMAVRAGADLLVFANQEKDDAGLVERVTAALAGAVAAGRVPQSAIDAAHARILAAKRGLAARPPPALTEDGRDCPPAEPAATVDRIDGGGP